MLKQPGLDEPQCDAAITACEAHEGLVGLAPRSSPAVAVDAR